MIFFIFVAIFSASYSIGAEMPVSDEDAQIFLREFEAAIENLDAVGIFSHNASIGLPMFVPFFGIPWGLFAAWSTGFAFSALVVTSPMLSELPPLSLLYLSPFGVMELTAYSLGMARSFLFAHTIIKRYSIKNQIRPTAIEVGIVIGLLLAGGFLEHMMIEQFGGDLDFPES